MVSRITAVKEDTINKTSIEWVRNPDGSQGYTWNPVTGCLNGCEYCYARKSARGRLFIKYQNNQNVAVDKGNLMEFEKAINDPFYPRFWPERLEELLAVIRDIETPKPKGIFVCDMGELFGDWIPECWQRQIFGAIWLNPQHRFYLLTKQPQNLIKFSPFPDNCWVGVTVTDGDTYTKALRGLAQVDAAIKYIAFEPLLQDPVVLGFGIDKPPFNWVIIGAQIKPAYYPKIEWISEIESAARLGNIAIFEKENLKPLLQRDLIQEIPK